MMVFYVKDHETQACEFFIIISSMGMIAACQSHINDETRFWFFRLKIRCFVRANLYLSNRLLLRLHLLQSCDKC